MYEGCNEHIIVPPDTQRIKSTGFQIVVTSYFNARMNIYSSYLVTSRVPDDLGHTHVRAAYPVQTVQLSVNRLRIFKQLA